MAKINLYPRFARNMLVLLFAAFTTSFVFLAAEQHFGLVKSSVSYAASVIFALLALPVLSTASYVSHLVENEGRRLQFTEDQNLRELVSPLLVNSPHKVKVGKYPSDDRNAFAISSIFGNNSTIGLSTALLAVASREQLVAIAAHEVAHIKNGDTKSKAYILAFNHTLKTYPFILAKISQDALKWGAVIALLLALLGFVGEALLASVANAFSFLSTFLVPIIKFGALPLGCIVAFIVLTHLLDRIFFAYSREREFAADALGAAMTSPAAMISALDLLTDSGAFVGVFDTHPPLAKRIKRLRELNGAT